MHHMGQSFKATENAPHTPGTATEAQPNDANVHIAGCSQCNCKHNHKHNGSAHLIGWFWLWEIAVGIRWNLSTCIILQEIAPLSCSGLQYTAVVDRAKSVQVIDSWCVFQCCCTCDAGRMPSINIASVLPLVVGCQQVVCWCMQSAAVLDTDCWPYQLQTMFAERLAGRAGQGSNVRTVHVFTKNTLIHT